MVAGTRLLTGEPNSRGCNDLMNDQHAFSTSDAVRGSASAGEERGTGTGLRHNLPDKIAPCVPVEMGKSTKV